MIEVFQKMAMLGLRGFIPLEVFVFLTSKNNY